MEGGQEVSQPADVIPAGSVLVLLVTSPTRASVPLMAIAPPTGPASLSPFPALLLCSLPRALGPSPVNVLSTPGQACPLLLVHFPFHCLGHTCRHLRSRLQFSIPVHCCFLAGSPSSFFSVMPQPLPQHSLCLLLTLCPPLPASHWCRPCLFPSGSSCLLTGPLPSASVPFNFP